MLKYIRGLILVAVILIANACVPPTHAASATVMITHIQAGGAGAALQELIIIYNNSSEEVDITDWCVKNKNNVKIACFQSMGMTERLYLPADSYATIGSMEYMATLYSDVLSVIYSAVNRSSGDIVGSNDVISLVDAADVGVDSHNWSTGLAGGSVLMRALDEAGMRYLDTDQASDWQAGTLQGIPMNGVMRREGLADICLNIDGVQAEIPSGLELRYGVYCLTPLAQLLITELLPNPSSHDTGREFIEIYNPTEAAVSLADYAFQVGPSFEKQFDFPMGIMIEPFSYMVLDNATYDYSLLNSSSRVRLVSLDGAAFDETPSYQDPKDDMAWALIDGLWQYAHPTSGAANYALPDEAKEGVEEPSRKPCAINQYRSPETNRCRNIAVASTSAPCKLGQYRSKETNRCRNITTDTGPKPCTEKQERNPETGRCRNIVVATVPTPCKEGQERNPETNRCRTIVAITKADYAVLGTQTSSNGSWYIWAAIGGLILAALGYAVWEWRYELRKFLTALSARFARRRK